MQKLTLWPKKDINATLTITFWLPVAVPSDQACIYTWKLKTVFNSWYNYFCKVCIFFLSLFRVNFLTRTIKHFSWKASKLKWMSLTTQKYKQNYLIDLVNSWALGHQICLPQSPCHQISPCFLDPMKQILPLRTLVSLSCWAFCCSVRIVSLISVYVAWH